MEKHVTILAILHIALGSFGILAACIVYLILTGSGIATGDREILQTMSIIGTAAASFLLLVSAPGIIAGVALLSYREWARILTIVLAVLNLINIPFGTALGIYALWVLMDDRTIESFMEKHPVAENSAE